MSQLATNLLPYRSVVVNATVLSRLAERWRRAGMLLACLARDGKILWYDPEMPRLPLLALAPDLPLAQYVRTLPEVQDRPLQLPSIGIPGLEASLVPMLRRRRVYAWLLVMGRHEAFVSGEEIHRLAARSSEDSRQLVGQLLAVPPVAPAQTCLLARVVQDMYEDMQSVLNTQQELSNVTEQLTELYEEINLLYKISNGMRFSQKPQAFLDVVCRELLEIGNFRSVLILPAERDDELQPPRVESVMASQGHTVLPERHLISTLQGPILEALIRGEAQVHNDLSVEPTWARLRGLLERFVCVPLLRDRRPIGVLMAIDKKDCSEFDSVDLKLLNNVGNQCSIFMENANLYQDMRGLFLGVLQALTRSIDAKDPYTRGHSQRVADLSRCLAVQIGLPDEQCERIYLAGLLHDVGKIGVPEAVLTKPGRLSDSEFEAIKKHPTIGAQILGNIKQLQDIIPGVLYHHERWDGRGYPYSLAGENIPLLGRIICVADSFDAMSSTRTYRPAMPLETVLQEIRRCAGIQFDPELAQAFVTMDTSHFKPVAEESVRV